MPHQYFQCFDFFLSQLTSVQTLFMYFDGCRQMQRTVLFSAWLERFPSGFEVSISTDRLTATTKTFAEERDKSNAATLLCYHAVCRETTWHLLFRRKRFGGSGGCGDDDDGHHHHHHHHHYYHQHYYAPLQRSRAIALQMSVGRSVGLSVNRSVGRPYTLSG